ncbi:MAG: tRNA (adenosine(37)-N6)-threonylcarbamoyltransferase complex dimerization subunit type 1 TsaB [Bdellovibrionales bacterium]|nr:tRNA (adenosine(37)-N6)-threonylcarbamoyltransferase complex dimerization subunit type 1 TsaB [Bdellovibrionales bacterium]
MKLVLIAETSSPCGGLSLLECSDKYLDAVVRDCQQWQRESSHSEVVTGAVRILLERNALQLREINLFGVGVGPGSFTGIRVGINMMRAFAYSFKTPLFGYSSLEALALSTHRQELPIVCLANAFKNMVYGATYTWTETGSLQELVAPCALGLDQISQLFNGPSRRRECLRYLSEVLSSQHAQPNVARSASTRRATSPVFFLSFGSASQTRYPK